jgi:hypothetical protein
MPRRLVTLAILALAGGACSRPYAWKTDAARHRANYQGTTGTERAPVERARGGTSPEAVRSLDKTTRCSSECGHTDLERSRTWVTKQSEDIGNT